MIALFTLSESVQALKIAQKYDLVMNHMYRHLHKNHAFSTQYPGGCNGSFQHVWLSDTLGRFTVTQVDGGAFCVAFAIRDCDTGHMDVLEDQCSFADYLYNPTDLL